MKRYTIINENDEYIVCVGIYEDYYTAVGSLYCKLYDCIDEWVEAGYKLISKEEFIMLEANSGYGWFAKLISENGNKVNERWYLLECEEEKQ